MPWVEQGDGTPVIDFGNTLEVCGIMVMYKMLKNSQQRVLIKFDQI
jgi:hypothetical protein